MTPLCAAQRPKSEFPSVVVLRDYVKPQKRVAFTRFNLFLRDGFQCQYCGSKGDLTFDHVVPRKSGGVTSWENVVAACSKCNLKKGSKALRHSGLSLRQQPRQPGAEELRNLGRRFPQTTCMKVGWISYTGIRNWSLNLRTYMR
jgi:5-methylcytosine-specific restriction endonuclease McrA